MLQVGNVLHGQVTDSILPPTEGHWYRKKRAAHKKKEQFIFVAEDDENQSKFNVKYMEDEKRDKLTVCKHGLSSGYNLFARTLDLKQKFKLFIYIFIQHLGL